MNTHSVNLCLPPTPTAALPGTPEKVRILAERARLHVALWHPLDARGPGSEERANDRRLADLCAAS